jgi:hypothetical protein
MEEPTKRFDLYYSQFEKFTREKHYERYTTLITKSNTDLLGMIFMLLYEFNRAMTKEEICTKLLQTRNRSFSIDDIEQAVSRQEQVEYVCRISRTALDSYGLTYRDMNTEEVVVPTSEIISK